METLNNLVKLNLARARATAPGSLRNLYLLLASRAGKLVAEKAVQ